jgi:hypothetical protein
LPEPYRVAVYYAPAAEDPLWARGCRWLGRDPATGASLKQPDVEGIAAHTTDPRRYGFHATLKPPMRLAERLDDFLSDVERLARRLESFDLPTLSVQKISRFVALCPTAPSPALQALADACVTELDAHRRPEDPEALAKRAAGRSIRQLGYLQRWGYPLVLEDWRFHMTLSNSTDHESLLPNAEKFFADALAMDRRVENLTVFVEHEPNTPFQILTTFRLGQ